MFPTSYSEILNRIDRIDPVAYGRTRNFVDGAVTQLSPYISRGVISTKQVMKSVLDRGHSPEKIEKFIQELAWRDYWQQVWIAFGDDINNDIQREQPNVQNHKLSKAIVKAQTGIEAIDTAIKEFYQKGYLHNHVRMYIASIACNVGGNHWRLPAHWMYYHLLDGDWASNALSWQWVAGTNAGKVYYANQENINKYTYSNQRGTFLDVDYSIFEQMSVPKVMEDLTIPKLETPLPVAKDVDINSEKPTLIYNLYNLDPCWHSDMDANRILLFEPRIFEKYPVSKKVLDFATSLSANIDGIQIFVGEFDELVSKYTLTNIIYKEHPINRYVGTEESRDWMFQVSGYYKSFFAFWKKCKKELKEWNQPTLFG